MAWATGPVGGRAGRGGEPGPRGWEARGGASAAVARARAVGVAVGLVISLAISLAVGPVATTVVSGAAAGPATSSSSSSPAAAAAASSRSARADLACAGGGAAPAGSAVHLSSSLLGVEVTLSGTAAAVDGEAALSAPVLSISDPGTRRVTTSVRPATGAPAVFPAPLGGGAGGPAPLCLARFPGDRRPAVLLAVSSGGAHCCLVVRAYTARPGGWALTSDALGDSPAMLTVVAGSPAVVTADSTFAYRFADFAGSSLPVRVVQVVHGSFIDVTRHHPGPVDDQARALWRQFMAHPGDPLGILAAWTADRCELHQGASAFAELGTLARSGSLSAPADGVATPEGLRYVRALKAFLTTRGYCTR